MSNHEKASMIAWVHVAIEIFISEIELYLCHFS
jgi:hypothetical protein